MQTATENITAPGIYCKCGECQQRYGVTEEYSDETDTYETTEEMETRFQGMIDEQEVIDEGGFSKQSCDMCNSGLHGDRYIAHQLIDGNWYHIEICTDCLMELA